MGKLFGLRFSSKYAKYVMEEIDDGTFDQIDARLG
jgi:hypothetical protein